MLLFTAAAGIVSGEAVFKTALLGWEKLIHRELNLAESVAGIVCFALALLVGYAEIVCGNEHLNIPFQLYDCENSQSDCNGFFGLTVTAVKISVKAAAYRAGNS